MSYPRLNYYIFAIMLCLFASHLQAKTVYVTDQFKITLRSGESSKHKIIRMLPTGTALRVKKVNRDNGYTEVVTDTGVKGFVLTRQLLNEPVARERMTLMEAKIQKLEAAPSQLQQSLSELTTQHDELQQAHKELAQIKKEIEMELTTLKRTSANAVKISEERNNLRKQVAQLTHDMAGLKQENIELENNTAQQWFLIGAGVISLGIILGLILPHLRIRKRRDDWGSL